MKIHSLAALLAIGLGFWWQISRMDWVLIGSAITLVIIIELINTGIEALADAVTLDPNPKIKIAKDVTAGAVVVAAVYAVLVALIVFSKHW